MFGMKCCRPLSMAMCIAVASSAPAALQAAEAPLPRAALALAADASPKIDGVLDEPIWARGEGSAGLVVSGSGAKAAADTTFRVAYDRTSLYFGIQVEEPAMDQILASERKLDDKEILNDDYIEILLQPDITTGTYYSFMVNPLAARRDAAVMDSRIDVAWTAAAARQENGWSVEVAVPFNSLGITEYGYVLNRMLDDGLMRLNVGRQRQAGSGEAKFPERTAWSHSTAGFNEQKDFGHLVFTNYNIPLQRQFAEANAKIDVLKKLLPAARLVEMAAIESPLAPDTEVRTEAGYRKNLQTVQAAEARLNELLAQGLAPAPGTPTELLVSHLSPYDSVAKDRLAQVSFYANTASKKGPVTLNFKQAVNEYEHDSFVLSSSTGIKGLYIDATDLTSRQGNKIAAGKVKCSVIGYVNPSADRDFNYRLWNKIPAADIVEEIRHPVDLASYESKQIWVTVHSLNAKPGEYSGAVKVTDIDGKVLRSVPIKVTVWPVTLPQKPRLDYFMFTGVPFDGQTGELWADFLVDHYVSWVYMELPGDVSVGNRAVEHQGRDVKDIELGFDITGQKVNMPGIKWNNLERLKILRSRNLKLNFDTGEGMMPPVLLPDFVKYLKKAGFGYEDFRYKISDENQNDEMLPIFKAYRAADPKVRLALIPAGSWDITPFAPYTDSYICSTSVTAWKEWLPYFQKEQREKGKPFSIYTNSGAWTNRTPLSQVRSDLRYIWEIGATEYSAWTANIYPPTNYPYPYSVPAEGLDGLPMRDVRDLLPEQQSTSTFVYFRNESGVIYPITSKRLEAIRDGIKDWMYLTLLRDTLKQAQGAIPAELQGRAQQTLDGQVLARPKNDAEFAAAKNAMAGVIMELQAATAKVAKTNP